MSENPEIIPSVIPASDYRTRDKGVYIENVYGDRHHDTLFLLDPENPPPGHEDGSDQLYLNRKQAEIVRDRLIELLK